jgi:hypothetical protein
MTAGRFAIARFFGASPPVERANHDNAGRGAAAPFHNATRVSDRPQHSNIVLCMVHELDVMLGVRLAR